MDQKRILSTAIVLAVSVAICVWPVYSTEKDKASPNASKELSGTWKTNLVDLFLRIKHSISAFVNFDVLEKPIHEIFVR